MQVAREVSWKSNGQLGRIYIELLPCHVNGYENISKKKDNEIITHFF